MKCVSALSTDPSTESALTDVLDRVEAKLAGETADLAVVFASIHHAGALGRIADEIRKRGLGRHVLGCTGETVIGEEREVEGSEALSLWSIQLPGATLTPRRLDYQAGELSGWEGNASAASVSALILLGDPFSFPTDQFLKRVSETSPGLRVVGGMASASPVPGANRLLLDDGVFDNGAVAIEVGGPVSIRTVVSQGCRPIGRTMIVTRAERNVIRELGRRPAMEVLREVYEELNEDDQERVRQGLHIGRVINEYQDTFQRGDFLVRNVMGTDDAGGIAVTDVIRVGQTVQFHVRDAESADEDLRTLLGSDPTTNTGSKVEGALLFSCNGRGTRLFPGPDHDVDVLHELLGPVPVAGLFAMGEIGPVGGQNFVHGFTASVVIFESTAKTGD